MPQSEPIEADDTPGLIAGQRQSVAPEQVEERLEVIEPAQLAQLIYTSTTAPWCCFSQ